MSDFRFAIISDAHFHDIEADYGFEPLHAGGRQLSLRSWSDTRFSTRVFNESHTALQAALDDVKRLGIRHVVLLGDYSDDGQRITLTSLRSLLSQRAERDGIRFYALPGNHDIFGPEGRHQTKQFLDKDGQRTVVTSAPRAEAGAKADIADLSGHYCCGYPEGLLPMQDFGYFRNSQDLHWETPFGSSDDPADRQYEAVSEDGLNRQRLMDASYLVEPVAGVWLVMIDANVFEPKNGCAGRRDAAAFADSSNAGWNGILQHKRFLFDWLVSISQRAAEQGKKVLVFSHYPVIDPFDDQIGAEPRLFTGSNFAKRTPKPEAAQSLIEAGVDVHFSGHLHVNSQTVVEHHGKMLTNIAVPSLVAYPPAFKVVRLEANGIVVEDVVFDGLPMDQSILDAYGLECDMAGDARVPALEARQYGGFLIEHVGELCEHRYLPREWPEDAAAAARTHSLAGICGMAGFLDYGPDAAQIPMMLVVRDWYLLRASGNLAFGAVPGDRLKLYETIAAALVAEERCEKTVPGFFRLFLVTLGHFVARARNAKTFLAR
ncbi:metallophosphoesterase family protein [Roseibium litorale]|uniref:Metallophosphoesterase n=1 Tax=Roseibium litorale TaxID=2803841 RepID=A0ABR9CTT9_9HYPH|nr:metallophosphoesterase [Roseibium litorale]MBD8894229.1 metallophosphoesterase [Roseibium litorale]